MIEIPEALTLSSQINDTIYGKRITNVTAARSPHKFAWYHGEPQEYHNLLTGKIVGKAKGYGGLVETRTEDAVIVFGDGVGLRFHPENQKHPKKHQLLIEFEDFSAVSASVSMYGGIWCFKEGEFEDGYYLQAKQKPSPLSDKFNKKYFQTMISDQKFQKLSAKAFLATEQRIPGLGNGVLQDILFNARIHPRKKIKELTDKDREALFGSIKATLAEMVSLGGRDTEKDLFGCPGGYKTRLSRNTVNKPCPVCGGLIKKEAYMGGSIYFCSGCQVL